MVTLIEHRKGDQIEAYTKSILTKLGHFSAAFATCYIFQATVLRPKFPAIQKVILIAPAILGTWACYSFSSNDLSPLTTNKRK